MGRVWCVRPKESLQSRFLWRPVGASFWLGGSPGLRPWVDESGVFGAVGGEERLAELCGRDRRIAAAIGNACVSAFQPQRALLQDVFQDRCEAPTGFVNGGVHCLAGEGRISVRIQLQVEDVLAVRREHDAME